MVGLETLRLPGRIEGLLLLLLLLRLPVQRKRRHCGSDVAGEGVVARFGEARVLNGVFNETGLQHL